jgi:hypothetical protein
MSKIGNRSVGRAFALGLGAVLLVTVAGTGAVAGDLIGSGDINNNSIKSKDVRTNTLRSSDIKDGSLQPRDLGNALKRLIGNSGVQGPAQAPAANLDALEDRVSTLENQVALLMINQNCAFDFPDQKMWEVSWGWSFDDRNGNEPKFTATDNGGLVEINDKPTDWTDPHLYVTGPVKDRVVKYTFADGTIRTATVSAGADACPVIEWDLGE